MFILHAYTIYMLLFDIYVLIYMYHYNFMITMLYCYYYKENWMDIII